MAPRVRWDAGLLPPDQLDALSLIAYERARRLERWAEHLLAEAVTL